MERHSKDVAVTAKAAMTANERIIAEITSWPGVELHRGSRGELSARVGRREIGHFHGDLTAHFGFPIPVWEELMARKRVQRHPIDHPGWAERRAETAAEIPEVIELFRLNYDRAVSRSRTREGGE